MPARWSPTFSRCRADQQAEAERGGELQQDRHPTAPVSPGLPGRPTGPARTSPRCGDPTGLPVRHLERIGGQDHQVGELAHLERALLGLLEVLVRGVRGHRAQRGGDVDALLRAEDVAGPRATVDAGPEQANHVRRHDGSVVVHREGNAPTLCGAHRTDPLRALHAEDRVAMPVAPVEGMSAEKNEGIMAELGVAVELIFAGDLGVNHDGAMVTELVLRSSLLHRFDELIGGGVTIGVSEHRRCLATE